MSKAKDKFDADYKVVRRLLIQGDHTLATAKMWLHKHGVATTLEMQSEVTKITTRQAGLRADRDLAVLLQHMEKAEGDEKEDE